FENLKADGFSESQILRIINIIAQKKIENAINLPSVSIYGELDKIGIIQKLLPFVGNEVQTGNIFDPRNSVRIKTVSKAGNIQAYFENLMKVKLISEKASFAIHDSFKKHSYSEKIWPFFARDIYKTDAERGISQDLLVSATEKDLVEFGELSKKAFDKYNQILLVSEKLNAAWETRDFAANYLPWITHWLVLENPKDLTDKNAFAWDKNLGILWDKYHKLNQMLVNIPSPYLDKDNKFKIDPN
ncbi:MAG: hypothetical protein ACK47R_04870, partial [Planctomycetia bacterium]